MRFKSKRITRPPGRRKRGSPDHAAAIGAPVLRLVAALEPRRLARLLEIVIRIRSEEVLLRDIEPGERIGHEGRPIRICVGLGGFECLLDRLHGLDGVRVQRRDGRRLAHPPLQQIIERILTIRDRGGENRRVAGRGHVAPGDHPLSDLTDVLGRVGAAQKGAEVVDLGLRQLDVQEWAEDRGLKCRADLE